MGINKQADEERRDSDKETGRIRDEEAEERVRHRPPLRVFCGLSDHTWERVEMQEDKGE